MLTDKKLTYYQPELYSDNGTNIDWDCPEGLWSFQAFPTREECEAWLKNNGYEANDVTIHVYHDDDIEDVTLIDEDGCILPRIEEFTDEEISCMLTDGVLMTAGSIDNLHATRQPDETEDQFMNRVYGAAHQMVTDAIAAIELSDGYNFQSFIGLPDADWYDEARDEAIQVVMNWMLENYPF